MLETTPDLQINSRSIARLISNAGFRRMTSDSGARTYGKQLKKLVVNGGEVLPEKCSLLQLMNLCYDHLQDDYRYEYVYKTKLLSDFILKNYSLDDTIILNEFRIGKSVADIVLVNGTNKVFEIKTELDSPERLKTQLSDYYKGFSEVYIVTHYTMANKYRACVDEHVGIIEFDSEYSLQTTREAVADYSKLDNRVMMKSLRKNEFLNIIKQIYGELPITTQVKLYNECLNLASRLESQEMQRYFLSEIKKRITPTQKLVATNQVPDYLKFFCYLANFTEKQYLVLPTRLSCLV
jgi:hypothetical protein